MRDLMMMRPTSPDNCESAFELALRFNTWAAARTTPITAAAIADRWEVSRATSYRWLRGYRNAQNAAARANA